MGGSSLERLKHVKIMEDQPAKMSDLYWMLSKLQTLSDIEWDGQSQS